jgi:hypothetical protein
MVGKNEMHRNIEAETIPLLIWDSDEGKQESIKFLYETVQAKYLSVISWYLQRKSSARITARRLRRLAIMLTTIGAAGFVVTAMNAGEQWAKVLGTSSSALLVLAAGLIAYDRFFGFSSSWIRFILTALLLQKKLNAFQTVFNQLSLAKTQDQNEILKLKMEKIQDAYEFLYSQLQNEAHQWADEFRGNLNRSVTEMVEELRTCYPSGERA